MEELLSIDVLCRGKEYSFEARIVSQGYTQKFHVLINGIEVIYEPDEERKYRAILKELGHASIKDLDIDLIKAVGEQIELIRQA